MEALTRAATALSRAHRTLAAAEDDRITALVTLAADPSPDTREWVADAEWAVAAARADVNTLTEIFRDLIALTDN